MSINIIGKIGNLTKTTHIEPLDMTIGLWHESIPSTTWQVGSYNDLLNGNATHPNLGFKSYATNYVNYVQNLINIGKTKGIQPGEFYFAVGDPGPINWSYTNLNNFKYYIPDPGGSHDPMINEYLIIKLQEKGIREFGLVVDMGKKKYPWVWTTTENKIIKTTTTSLNHITFVYDNYNPTAEKVFILVNQLNAKLKKYYDSKNITISDRLYIKYIGYDNEGFGEAYISGVDSSNNCPGETNKIVSSGVVINYLWDHYYNQGNEWDVKKSQWGITGASPPLKDTCKVGKTEDIPNTIREYAFIEFYNVPGNDDAVHMADHPCFLPCPTPWVGDVKKFVESNYKVPSCDGTDDHGYINSYYGLNTPSRKNEIISTLKRDMDKLIDTDGKCTIYEQTTPTLKELITGTDSTTAYKYPLTTKYRDKILLSKMYTLMNTENALIIIADSLDYKIDGKSSGENTRWMLSIENFSSSLGTIKDGGLGNIINTNELPKNQIDKAAPESSIAIMYEGNGEPFELTGGNYILSHLTTTSGTFEAFGGWELDEIMDFMVVINKEEKVVKNFMLYEFNFAKVGHCDPGYS